MPGSQPFEPSDAQQRERVDHPRLCEDAQDRREHAERGGPALPGYVREFEADVPEVGSEFLGVLVRPGARPWAHSPVAETMGQKAQEMAATRAAAVSPEAVGGGDGAAG